MRSNLFFGLSFFTIFVNCGEAVGAGCLQAVLPFSVRGPVGIFGVCTAWLRQLQPIARREDGVQCLSGSDAGGRFDRGKILEVTSGILHGLLEVDRLACRSFPQRRPC